MKRKGALTSPDWPMLASGFLLGLLVSGVFFAGLDWGIKLALKSSQPNARLLLSFVLRLALLLGVGFLLASMTSNLWSILGYAMAFFVVRFIALRRAVVSGVR